MTEQEAIKWIGDRMCYGRYTPQKHSPFIRDECCKAGEMAINALENMQKLEENKTYLLYREYLSLGTVEELRALKEKQIAKKPRFYAHNYYCTECGNLVGNNEFEWQRFLYCDNCGQKLDWSEV